MNIAMILGLFPSFMSMIAVYFILKALGLSEGSMIRIALIIVFSAGSGVGFYVAKGFFDTIPKSLDEAAIIDGASRWQRLWNITIPSIVPLVVMMFTMQIGLVFMTGFDKVLLLYMPTTYEFSDCLSTYTYRMAFSAGNDFSLSTASGLLQSIIGTLLLIFGNKMSEKATKMSLF